MSDERMVLVRATDLDAATDAAHQCSPYFREKYGYTEEADGRLCDALHGKPAVLMGYVLRERGGDRAWIRVSSGTRPMAAPGYPLKVDPCEATRWRDPVEAQEYGDRFCGDVEVLPVYVHAEGK